MLTPSVLVLFAGIIFNIVYNYPQIFVFIYHFFLKTAHSSSRDA